ncbi:hypothetical protein AVEN_221528-1 [Araneus ventricosus]|uniref:Uncharacterized protein n=1 Tax=Araneus ventricosus TaxID=182803 RepID=A0A4Y2PAJ4_ARAVE|nr:hypothetical protein AVEN_221528-1 [Araneus ventricosus]
MRSVLRFRAFSVHSYANTEKLHLVICSMYQKLGECILNLLERRRATLGGVTFGGQDLVIGGLWVRDPCTEYPVEVRSPPLGVTRTPGERGVPGGTCLSSMVQNYEVQLQMVFL